ncbi:MAG: amino acid ABC transporter permease [Acidimicrobiales bacterium]
MKAAAGSPSPIEPSSSPGEWVRKNLFNSPLNAAITVVLTPIALYAAYRFFRFVFVTGRWDAVDTNLELFMIGQYPREERWRIVAQLLLLAPAIGLAVGLVRATANATAEETGEPRPTTPWTAYVGSYWTVVLFVVTLLVAFVDTTGPWLLAIGCLAGGVVGWLLGGRVPPSLIPVGWSVAALFVAASFQVLSGTGGWAWFYLAAALVPALGVTVRFLPAQALPAVAGLGALVGAGTLVWRPGVVGLIAATVAVVILVNVKRGDRIDGARLGLYVLGGLAAYVVSRAIGHGGIDWKEWGGLQLNLVATVGAIVLAFPLGVLLAVGRRSDLPAIRVLCVAYIEFFRGAPLITFLLSAQFFLGFFLDSDTPLSLVTRGIAAVTLFSAAYIAEIIRGGLQAVPKGQVEAGQALGLAPLKITRLIVLPQALRAVIPAMVGQFISLWKDTTLFTIISLPEFLDIRNLVHAQADFRGFGIAETLTFVAFGFWAVAYTMSKESQRLERRLGVGHR